MVRLVKYEIFKLLEILINFAYTIGNYNCNEKSPKSQGCNDEMRLWTFLGIKVQLNYLKIRCREFPDIFVLQQSKHTKLTSLQAYYS